MLIVRKNVNFMNRQILAAALFQHSSKVQPFKEESLDAIVERIVYFSSKSSLSISSIQNIFTDISGYTIPSNYFKSSCERLVNANKIRLSKENDDIYIIDAKRKREIEISENSIIQKQNKLIDKLFKNSPERKTLYLEPFWFAVSFIFSNIGDYSAKIVNGNIDKEQILFPVLDKSIEECKSKFKIDLKFFRQKLIEFFSDLNDPLYIETKCILAQNYFIAKSIGINPDSETFSKDVFENQIIYLDTNVLLAIVSKFNSKHSNAIAFIKALNKLKTKICITHATIIEYETWVQNEFDRIRKTSKQIPSSTKSKIGSPVYKDFYEIYLLNLSENKDFDTENILNDLEKHYFNYKEILLNLMPNETIVYIDDAWFDSIVNEPRFGIFVKLVKEKYHEVGSLRNKGEGAAIHDAKVLLWLDKESNESGIKHLFVTTDTSMPLIRFEDNENTSNIVLESILQWLLPLTNGHNDSEVNKTISEIIKQRILPKEFIFEMKDFMIFDQLHMECQELPAEDVENCIIYLKKNASGLNPNIASDREKFASEIAKYFIDPTKKYKFELAEKEKEYKQLEVKLGDVYTILEDLQTQSSEKDKELAMSKKQHEEEIIAIQSQYNDSISQVNETLNNVTTELDELRSEKRNEKISEKIKLWKRPAKIALILSILLILFGILEFLPDWGWNYPAKILSKINSFESTSMGKFQLYIGLNIFFLTGPLITLLVIIYNRLINKNNIEKNIDEIRSKIK